MRFVDYSFVLAQVALERLGAGLPINVRHYNATMAWLALAHDALVDPDLHLSRSMNEGSLGDLLYTTTAAPAPLGQDARAIVAGMARPASGAPAWQETIAAGLSGAARELGRNYRLLPQRVGDSIPGHAEGTNVFRPIALVGDFALASIDLTALELSTVVWVHPSTATTLVTLRGSIDAMLRALVSGNDASLPSLVAASQPLIWLADERRVNAMRSEATLVVVLIAMLIALSWLGRQKPRTAARQGQKAGPIRMPGPNQPIGRVGAGPGRLA